MEREALFIVMFREGSLLERFGSVWDRKASPKLLNAPLASPAALARLLRSPHRGENRSARILEASWDLLEASWKSLRASLGVLEASWNLLEASWKPLGACWRRLGSSGGVLGASWKRLELDFNINFDK